MKGHTIGGGQKRPTKSGAGMTAKGVAKYRRDNPGSKLKTAVTGKVKKVAKLLKDANHFAQDLKAGTQREVKLLDVNGIVNNII